MSVTLHEEIGLEWRIQDAAVAVLKRQATLAEHRVEADRIDAVAANDMPRMIVLAETDAEGIAAAGGPPAFRRRMRMVVHCLVARARLEEASQAINSMIVQVQLALLEDPAWNRMPENIESMRCSRTFTKGDSLVVADGRIEFVMTWMERYQTRITDVLTGATLRVDTARPFDRTGIYPPPNPPYPVPEPPRASGPDGRIEIGAVIELPVAE